MSEEQKLNIQITRHLDQDWAEAVEWLSESKWTNTTLERFTRLFACDVDGVRVASRDEIDCLQRLARVAFWECWKRVLDHAAEAQKS